MGTRPWKTFGEGPTEIVTRRTGENLKPYQPSDIRFTTKDDNLYAFVLAPPTSDIVIKTLAQGGLLESKIEHLSMLGADAALTWERSTEALTILLPESLPDQPVVAFKLQL